MRIEDLGVFVVVKKIGEDIDDCRGFCLSDADLPPIIVINSAESSMGARSFSLLHEYAHILLGAPGVSGTSLNNAHERFCNQFATEFLMPPSLIQRVFGQPGEQRDYDYEEVKRRADTLKCSQQALALRLEELNYASAGYYGRWRVMVAGAEPPGPTFARMSYAGRMVRRWGTGFMSLVLSAADRGDISEVDAYRATKIKPEHYGPILDELENSRQRVAEVGG